jgi:UDP-galactopyranose mutase
MEIPNYQGTAMMNYTSDNVDFTRIIEHKHFDLNTGGECSWVTHEFPVEYNPEDSEPYYPVNDNLNNERYAQYLKLTLDEPNGLFGGRLAEYRYYDMDDVIESAVGFIKKHF